MSSIKAKFEAGYGLLSVLLVVLALGGIALVAPSYANVPTASSVSDPTILGLSVLIAVHLGLAALSWRAPGAR
jgi:hypothetical protein